MKCENLNLEHNDLNVRVDASETTIAQQGMTIAQQGMSIAQQGITITGLNLKYENLNLEHNGLNVRFNASETTRRNTSALVMAFDLIKLFRSYGFSMYGWNAVTEE